MIRSRTLLLTAAALSGQVPPLAAQTVVAVSCFELRAVRETPVDLPDTLQVIVVESDAAADAIRLPEHEGLGLGQFADGHLVVELMVEDEEGSRTLRFRPGGDRMVGWLVEDRDDVPDPAEPWSLEAHRFPCRRPPDG